MRNGGIQTVCQTVSAKSTAEQSPRVYAARVPPRDEPNNRHANVGLRDPTASGEVTQARWRYDFSLTRPPRQ